MVKGNTAARRIVADYRRPQALLVPHYPSTIQATLEAIAERTSPHCGVILLAQDPAYSQAFVASQAQPERFHIITAPYDTPWLRDRSPIAVRRGKTIEWILPQLDTPERPLDENLFQSITRKTLDKTTLCLPQGNLVAGPSGLAVVLLAAGANETAWQQRLDEYKQPLGVKKWILAPAFDNEITGHADVHVRFLGTKLASIAWSENSREDREKAEYLQAKLSAALPSIHILRLPLRSDGPHYASPLNWLQFGRQLIIPRYELTPAADVRVIRERLQQAGFRTGFVFSPTLEYAGSLHCLTASIFV
jgi:hypothetical protein